MLSEISQTEKDKYPQGITYMWNIYIFLKSNIEKESRKVVARDSGAGGGGNRKRLVKSTELAIR